MDFSELVQSRHSVKSYDPDKDISDAELKELLNEVVLSPSSFNLQHWKFIAVRDANIRSALKEAAWGQEQVATCSVIFVVCGRLDAYKDAPDIYRDAPKNIQEMLLPKIHKFYEGNIQLQRDEAVRSASLAAMTFMYAARNRGYDTVPMIGYDPEAVVKLFQLTPNTIPVMLLALGHKKNDPKPRSMRRPLSEVVSFNSLDGPSLI